MNILKQKILMLIVLHLALSDALKRACSLTNLKEVECLIFETCVANSSDVDMGNCECRKGFERSDGEMCVHISSNGKAQEALTSDLSLDSQSHFAAAILIPLLIVFFVITIYVSHRFKLITWVRTKMNYRKNNYDEVMIGQDLNDDDDPPLH